MSQSTLSGSRIAGISTCVPSKQLNNSDVEGFSPIEIRKVVAMAGIAKRRVVSGDTTSVTLCRAATEQLLNRLGWEKESIDGLIFVTQSPDHFLPSCSCLIHDQLDLPTSCACFDVGLGCSGYPYGLWLAAMMVASGGHKRVLVLHGETPSLFTAPDDRSTVLLFGDCGSATAVEADGRGDLDNWHFTLHTDGKGHRDLIIDAGGFKNRFDPELRNHYLKMNGANLFNFTIKRVPTLINDTIALSGLSLAEVDYFVFHQSNLYMMQHIMGKLGLPAAKVPLTLGDYGNTGGTSVVLTLTKGIDWTTVTGKVQAMLLGYGVGLSWGAALLPIEAGVAICHGEI
jgi:3-oxoacyl-[acyl-carrier-protein] synthase III